MVYQTFHCRPRVEQSHAAVVQHIAVLISRLLLVPRLKRKWSVNEIEIQIVESVQTRLKNRFDALRPMMYSTILLIGDQDRRKPYLPYATTSIAQWANNKLVTLNRVAQIKPGDRALLSHACIGLKLGGEQWRGEGSRLCRCSRIGGRE